MSLPDLTPGPLLKSFVCDNSVEVKGIIYACWEQEDGERTGPECVDKDLPLLATHAHAGASPGLACLLLVICGTTPAVPSGVELLRLETPHPTCVLILSQPKL